MVPPRSAAARRTIVRLALTLAGGLAVVMAMQAWLLAVSHGRAVQVFVTRAENRSQANADLVLAAFRQIDLVLLDARGHIDAAEVAAGADAAAPGRYAAMSRLLRERVGRYQRLTNLHVIGPDGHYVFSSLDLRPQIGIADRSYFQRQASAFEDRLVVSEPLLGRITKRHAIFCSRRLVTEDGTFAGIVMASIGAEGFAQELRAVDQVDWSRCLVAADGVIAARVPDHREQIGASVDPPVAAWLGGDARTWTGTALGETRPHIWGRSPVGDLPLTAITGYPVERALEQWRRDLHAHLAAALLLAAGGVAVLVLFARREGAVERAGELDRRLRSSELALADLAQRVPVGVFRLSERGGDAGLDYASPRCAELLGGLPADRASLMAMVHAKDRDRLAGAFAEATGRGALSWTGRLAGAGKERWLEVQASVIETADGVREWNGIVQDVSERSLLEEQLRQSEKMQAVGLLAGGIAHDFNNILAGISGFAELARRRHPPEPIAGHLAQISAGADRAKTLVQQILAFSRRSPNERVPLHLQSTVREVVNLLRATIPASIDMRVELAPDLGPVLADPGRIHQLVMNLCANAVHAMRGRGTLRIALAQVALAAPGGGRIRALPPGTYACLTVGDSGCGMDEATLRRIFEPFFTTKGPEEGTGLGLAVVWNVVDTHDGDIAVESAPGSGTTFRVLLPLIARPATATPPTESSALPTGSERLLVVDDEPAIRELLREVFAGLGYRVAVCATAVEALRLIERQPAEVDLIITDQTMPGMSGRELSDAAARIRPGLPLILCSGLDVPGHVDGPDRRFCAKPVNSEALARLVRTLLDRPA